MWKRKVVFCLTETLSIHNNDSSSTSDSSYYDVDSTTTNDSFLYSENDSNALYFPLMQYLSCGHKRHYVENYLQLVESWTEYEFKEHLRLSRQTALQLIDEYETSEFMPNHLYGIRPISGRLSIYILLWFMANTEPLRTISDRFNVSISSVFRIIRRLIAWLLTKTDEIITWPQHEKVLAVCEGFFSKRRIPQVLGAIDCTHIRIEKPSTSEQLYCNRKKFFSIHLQAIVDSNMRFTNVYIGEPGSLHDARILRRSLIYERANEEKETVFPNDTFLLGDSAYPSLPWLVPPFRDNGHLTPQQIEFNFIHSSTRMVVERTFGFLKGRFRRIKFFTEYRNMQFITDTVTAACILHNYCISVNDDFEVNEEKRNEDNDDISPNDFNNENIAGEDRRMKLFRQLFSE
ncbi:putative nuclease HARBI1 [Linepithema humile]|uniref:putative nuclease HARBI1 n=1 Tax=Linepithema humile TaxID=83485 RepID=UPI00351E599E